MDKANRKDPHSVVEAAMLKKEGIMQRASEVSAPLVGDWH